MLTKRATVWAAVSGLVGTCMIGISFAINPGPQYSPLYDVLPMSWRPQPE